VHIHSGEMRRERPASPPCRSCIRHITESLLSEIDSDMLPLFNDNEEFPHRVSATSCNG
jgi:hypothetical protein